MTLAAISVLPFPLDNSEAETEPMTTTATLPERYCPPTMAEGRVHTGEEARLDPKDERRQRESFRKRKKTLFKNANAISKRCKAEVYVVLLRKGKWFTFTSTEKLGWPPTAESMVIHF